MMYVYETEFAVLPEIIINKLYVVHSLIILIFEMVC
jgi:hypothetical protein